MKYLITLAIMVQIILIGFPASAEISSNARMLQKPEWDGAVVSGKWLSGEFRYQKYEIGDDEDADVIAFGPTFAASLPNLPELELGTRLWLMNEDYDHFKSETGLSDIDLWGKYQFFNNNGLMLSGGLMFSLPVGCEGVVHPRATGEFNLELFGAARYNIDEVFSVVGHLGIRKNSDMESELEGKGSNADVEGEIDGETQFEIGGGIIYQLQYNLNILGELNIATEAYDDAENDIELTGGVEYMLQPNLSLKGGLGLGMDDGAPDFELIIGGTVTF